MFCEKEMNVKDLIAQLFFDICFFLIGHSAQQAQGKDFEKLLKSLKIYTFNIFFFLGRAKRTCNYLKT